MTDISSTETPRRDRISGLLIAQFFGAFNDNAYKMMVALLAVAAARAAVVGGDALEQEQAAQAATTMAFVVLTIPLMVFSIPAMALGDRISKRTLILLTKGAEVVLMAAGTFALHLGGAGWGALTVLALMGAQSALFSPAKYGLLPEVLPESELSRANGYLELASFAAIILGTAVGGMLLDASGADMWIPGAVLTVFSVLGFAAALRVPRVPAAGQKEPLTTVIREAVRAVRGRRPLAVAVIGQTLYWGIASLISQNILVYGKNVLDLSDSAAGIPLAILAIGVGIGAIIPSRLSPGRIEPGWAPLGGLGLTLGGLALGVLAPGYVATLTIMVLLGVFSGLVVVPLNLMLQVHAPDERRGAVVALTNVLAFAGVLVGTLLCGWLSQIGFDTSAIFVASALLLGGATVWGFWIGAAPATRAIATLIVRLFFRMKARGLENVPSEGPALLTPNHVSFGDGMVLAALAPRPVRFLIDADWFKTWYMRPFFRAVGAVPIAANGGTRELLESLRTAGEMLDRGEIVCLFPEGEVSRNGALLTFRRGFERILKGRDVPVVPVHLHVPLRSALVPKMTRGRGVQRGDLEVTFGEPIRRKITAPQLRRELVRMESEGAMRRARRLPPLHHSVIRTLRRRPWAPMLGDGHKKPRTRGRVLVGSIALARRLREEWGTDDRVGFLLPPCVPSATAQFAATMSGRTAVHLNYTAGNAALASAVSQSGLRTVLTSRAFLEKVEIQLPEGVRVVFLEDVVASIGRGARLSALMGALLPMRWLERFCGARRRVVSSDPVTVIFSSGSTGEPKGVVLTHSNIASNCAGVHRVIDVGASDGIVGILPLFHSFGFMVLWLAAWKGARMAFFPNPTDAPAVGQLVFHQKLTMLVATPTFLQMYARRCTPEQFGTLRFVVTGAERLNPRAADEFETRFGIRPLEGYGSTECSPVVAVSHLSTRGWGYCQLGSRRGSVGRPIPGVDVKVVDPDTGEELPIGKAGMLHVRGPNVMAGYLGQEEKTAAVLRDGWYETGDVACLNEDGFLRITDRLARFSKIGGEMVPHGKVEEVLHDVVGAVDQVFAVTAVRDERKGERLVVLHTLDLDRIAEAVDGLKSSGLPKLFIPKADQFVAVAALPILGTGKLDLRQCRQLAEDAMAAAR